MTAAENEIINELVKRAGNGDREAFSKIVRLTMNKITALTYRMTGDRESARDLAQETFISAWQNLASFRGDAKFTSWLYRIASNKTLNHLNRASSRAEVGEEKAEAGAAAASVGKTPESVLHDRELREGILEFMQSLPRQQRLAFELKFYEGLTFEEISRTTDRALGTVKTNYRQAVGKLRQHARRKGWRS